VSLRPPNPPSSLRMAIEDEPTAGGERVAERFELLEKAGQGDDAVRAAGGQLIPLTGASGLVVAEARGTVADRVQLVASVLRVRASSSPRDASWRRTSRDRARRGGGGAG